MVLLNGKGYYRRIVKSYVMESERTRNLSKKRTVEGDLTVKVPQNSQNL